MSNLIEKIEQVITPIIESHDAFLIEINYRRERGSKILEIFVDSVSGVTPKLCSEISRDAAKAFDASELITDKYFLNVSSPGLKRPLKLLKQYYKHIGHTLEIKTQTGNELQIKLGQMIEVKEDIITIKTNTGEILLFEFNDIIEARIKTPW